MPKDLIKPSDQVLRVVKIELQLLISMIYFQSSRVVKCVLCLVPSLISWAWKVANYTLSSCLDSRSSLSESVLLPQKLLGVTSLKSIMLLLWKFTCIQTWLNSEKIGASKVNSRHLQNIPYGFAPRPWSSQHSYSNENEIANRLQWKLVQHNAMTAKVFNAFIPWLYQNSIGLLAS